MMRKFSKLFIILILLMIPNVVFGDVGNWVTNGDLANNHILSIEKFAISDSVIGIEGYSFISHQDNYAFDSNVTGLEKITKTGTNNSITPNLETYLIVYTGKWQDSYMKPDVCNNSNNCYTKKVIPVARDMYYARCSDDGCTAGDKSAVYNKRRNSGLINNNTCENDFNGIDGECIYQNVGFSVEVDLLEVIDKIGDTDISMKIASINSIRKSAGKSLSQYAKATGLNVHSSVCTVNGVECFVDSNGNAIVNSGDYTFQFSDFAKKAKFDGSFVMARKKENGVFSSLDYTYFQEELIYNILEVDPKQKLSRRYGYDSAGNHIWRGDYYDTMYKLESELITCQDNSRTCYNNYEANGTTVYYGSIVVPKEDNNGTTNVVNYWTSGNFLVFDGDLKIKSFTTSVIPIECDEVFKNTTVTDNEINCGKEDDYRQCAKSEKVSSSDSYVYILHPEQTNSCMGYGDKEEFDDKYYLKIKVEADLLFYQTAKFKFGSISPGVVKAGKGFNLGETTYVNSVTWMNANKKSTGEPYYRYSYAARLSSNACAGNSSFNIKNAGKYYVKKDNGSLDTKNYYTKLSDAAFVVMDRTARKVINKENIKNISFVSCDSNDASSCNINSPNKNVSGSWSINTSDASNKIDNYKYNGTIFGKTITNSYIYNLADSYVQVSGDDPGKALYANEAEGKINELINTGQKFYIDFKWVYDAKWPFNLKKNINPSFIDGMDWTLRGTCGVDVEDGYYTSASNDPGDLSLLYKYRSISLKSPFPKAGTDFSKIAINWRDWYKENNNVNRLSNTYSRDVLYKITVSKIDNNDKVSISDINKYTSHYGQLADFEKTGESKFVIDNFETRANVRSYCGLGFFSTDCDELWG